MTTSANCHKTNREMHNRHMKLAEFLRLAESMDREDAARHAQRRPSAADATCIEIARQRLERLGLK